MAREDFRQNTILITDEGAIEDDGAGKRRIRRDRLIPTDSGQRVGSPQVMRMPSGQVRAPRCTGLLLRNREGHLMMATSAHCIALHSALFKKVRCVVGQAFVADSFAPGQELSLSGIRHFEDSRDRDLAIWRLKQSHRHTTVEAPGLRLLEGDPSVAEGDEVVIVGHQGGHDCREYRGVVEHRIPPEGTGPLRGFNVKVDEAWGCLSGSPVFLRRTGQVLGILQGTRAVTVDEWIPHLLELRRRADGQGGLESGGARADRIRKYLLDRGALTDVWGNPTPLAESFEKIFPEATGPLPPPPDEPIPLTTPAGGLESAANGVRGALDDIVRLSQDDCDRPLTNDVFNVVSLKAAISIFLT